MAKNKGEYDDNDEVADAVDNTAEEEIDYKGRATKEAADKAKADAEKAEEAGDDFGKKRKDARK